MRATRSTIFSMKCFETGFDVEGEKKRSCGPFFFWRNCFQKDWPCNRRVREPGVSAGLNRFPLRHLFSIVFKKKLVARKDKKKREKMTSSLSDLKWALLSDLNQTEVATNTVSQPSSTHFIYVIGSFLSTLFSILGRLHLSLYLI
jgi:hypothetical protein